MQEQIECFLNLKEENGNLTNSLRNNFGFIG